VSASGERRLHDELLVTTRTGKSSALDEYKPYIHEHCNAGVTNSMKTRQ
jgi:hypothetical protein